MKKSVVLVGVIVAVAAAYTGMSWYVGMRSEETVRMAIERANDRIVKTMGPETGTLRARIEISEYRRGVFSSQARYTIVVNDSDDRYEFGMDDHMQHGPFPWALVRQGSFAPLLAYSRSQLVDTETVKRWFDAARGAMPLNVDTRIGFGGKGASTWTFAPLEWSVEQDLLSFSGGRTEVRFSNEFRDSTAQGHFSSLVMGGGADGDRVSLNDIRLSSQTAMADDEAVQVDSKLEAAALVIQDNADENLKLENISATLKSRQKAALLDASLRYDFERVWVGEIDLGSMSLGGEVTRFDLESFSALAAEYDAIASEHGAENDEDFDLTPQDEERLMAKLAPVLASSPAVALRPVIWRNEKGESTLSAAAAFQPLPDGAAANAENSIESALKEMRFELVISRPMLLQAFAQTGDGEAEKQQLEMLATLMYDRYVSELEQQGLVRREGERAFISIIYVDGSFDVNGQALSLEEFMSLFGAFFM